jgi:hypothetical protein
MEEVELRETQRIALEDVVDEFILDLEQDDRHEEKEKMLELLDDLESKSSGNTVIELEEETIDLVAGAVEEAIDHLDGATAGYSEETKENARSKIASLQSILTKPAFN